MHHPFHCDLFNKAAFCCKILALKYWTKNIQNTGKRALFWVKFDRDIFSSCVRGLKQVGPVKLILPPLPFNVSGGILVSASRAKFPISLSSHVGFNALITLHQHSPLPKKYFPTENWWSIKLLTSTIPWLYVYWFFYLDISRWQKISNSKNSNHTPLFMKMTILLLFFYYAECNR